MGENSIKLAEAVFSKGRREIVRLIKRPLPQEESVKEIKSIFESLKIRRQVRLNIPRHFVTVRFVKLPSTSEEEIRKMVKIEALKHVPYADEDTVSGYRLIEKQDDGYSNVLIAVAQAETVRREMSLLKKAGLTIESVSLGSETLLLWYFTARTVEEKAAVLVVNIDTGHIDIDVVTGDKLVFTRGVLYNTARPISPETIIDQVNVSLAAYKKESGRFIDKVALTGIQANVNELKDSLRSRIKIPVEVIDQMNNVTTRQGAYLELEGASFAELIGLSLKSDNASINILPENAQEEQRLQLMKRNMGASLTILAFIIVITLGVVFKKLYDKGAYVSYIDSEIAKIEPKVRTAKKMAKEIDIVTSKLSERPLAIDVASEVFKITPSNINLTMMEYESSKTLTLRGTAPSLSDAFKYVTILEKSPYFENVKVKYANKRVGTAREAADFEIICPITKVK